ncbi:MAG TPA: DUF502 domain-containing protein [Mesorhizobium sp.]|jgi:uncharacterized membrane protein|nr:DUF502 domain-containing protein [Mesorhizobium sp.]
MTRLRNYFLAGVVVTAPLAITTYLAWTVVAWFDSWVKPYIPARFSPDNYLPFAVPGFGLIVAVVLITFIGFLAANFIGRTVFGVGEKLLDRTPLVRNVYRGLKQIFETVLANRAELFNQVALFEYPRKGAWSIVFIAKQAESEINAALEPRHGQTVAVFRPITPNVTTGYLLYVSPDDLIPLKMSVEDAAKLLISAGLVGPAHDAVVERLMDQARREGEQGLPPAA